MKKVIYYFVYILLLVLISILPVSAKENKMCTRTETDLKVREKFDLGKNKNDILSTPCVDDMEKVYDFADLLTDNDESILFNNINEFISKTNYDLVVVTIDSNPKKSEVEYADDFYDYNYFGKNSTRDGLLLLIDMDNRKVYISTTGNAIKMYDDYRIDKIIDAGYDYLTSKDYFNTFKEMIEETNYYYSLGYPSSNNNLTIDENGNPHIIKTFSIGTILIISAVITLIVSLILYFKSRLKIKVGSTINYLNNANITTTSDKFNNRFVSKTLRASDTSSSGGSSGGSSTHSSSSGSSHGGGGRSF